jgi:modulator of FtsH protease
LVHAFDTAGWSGFFTAMVGASAALTGLLFVAVALNLDHILKGPTFLPSRAAETLATLLFVLYCSALVLVPQDIRLLGAEILVAVVPLLVLTLRSQLHTRAERPDDPLLWSISRMTATMIAIVPGLVAGISLAAHVGGGIYWLVPTAILGVTGAVYNAWVLLVEIVR